MTKLIATSVIRGSHQGESHGGVYLIDFDAERVQQVVDWNTAAIDWQGRGWDRGLRGIAFDGDRIFIAASDELFVYSPDFKQVTSYSNPFLKHCHEIAVYKRRLYLTSTGFDSLLVFDLDNNRFSWGLKIARDVVGFKGAPFDPQSHNGPAPSNELHINNVFCNTKGLFLSGLRTGALLVFNGRKILNWASLPAGIHNARPFRDGIVFNDTAADLVRYTAPDNGCSFSVPTYNLEQLTHTDMDDTRVARQGFGRGLCAINEHVIAAGSSPSTIALHDIDKVKTTKIVTLSVDLRNAIHGLEVWPYGDLVLGS